jgi:glucose-1-phosphate cytidylyltransferase
LCNVDLTALRKAHDKSGKIVTVTGVRPTSRFGTFSVNETEVAGYTLDTKLTGVGGYINGGFMLMEPAIFDHLEVFNECKLEREVFTKLAAKRLVGVFPHDGYWQAVDTERDAQIVNQLYVENKRPWLSLGGH